MNAIFNHLWQTTLFAAAAGLVTLAMRQNSARTRYWLWLVASVKFLVPFSLLVSLGERAEIPVTSGPVTAAAIETITTSSGWSFSPGRGL